MESTIRETSSVKRELDLVLTDADMAMFFDRIYNDARKKISIKGFRPGKTPVSVIKKLYGASLDADAIDAAVQAHFAQAIDVSTDRPIGNPAVTKMDRDEQGTLHVTVIYEVLPQFELGSYKGLPARRIVHHVTDHEVDHEIDHLRERLMTNEPAEFVANDSHIVTVDLQKLDADGQPIAGEVSNGVKVYLAAHGVHAGMKESLLNSKVGDTFDIGLPTGEDESIINYRVTVTDIQRAVLPEVTDEFARQLTGDDSATVESLREMVRGGIESGYRERYARMFRDSLVGAVVEAHHFDVPDVLTHEALQSFLEDIKRQNKGEMPAGFDVEAFSSEMRPTAERTVKWALIRDRIVDAEGLKPEEADYEGLAETEAERTGIEYERLLGYFKRNPATAERIVAEKAVQLLEDYAIIEEVEDTHVPGLAVDEHSHEH